MFHVGVGVFPACLSTFSVSGEAKLDLRICLVYQEKL